MPYTSLTISRLNAVVIHLTKGYHCIVDAADFPVVSKWKWYAHVTRDVVHGRAKSRYVYASREKAQGKGRGRRSMMHRELLDAKPDQQIDHDNHNTLDNRRSNLIRNTQSGNCHNRVKRPDCSSKYMGVVWHSGNGRYIAQIKVKQKNYHLGCFDDPEEAARVRDEAAKKHFASPRLNFP
jgi:hypothetical protein